MAQPGIVDVSSWKFLKDSPAEDVVFMVGPIVGAVTETSARLLVEPAGDTIVRVVVTANDAVVCETTKALKAGRPSPIEITGLSAGVRYHARVMMGSQERAATFLTPAEKQSWKVAVVSCNNHLHVEKIGLWDKLGAVLHSVDAILHLGDQIYGDEDAQMKKEKEEAGKHTPPLAEANPDSQLSAWQHGINLCKELPKEQWESHKEAIREFYRRTYRTTWNFPSVAKVLASCANYMVVDDHEVTDDMGDLEEHRDPKSLEYFVGTCAYETYLEYQVALQRDVTYSLEEPAYSCFKLGPRMGVILTDNRIERSLRRVTYPEGADWKDANFLGPHQWAAIKKAVEGELAECDVLLFGTPTPAIFLSHSLTDQAAKVISDAMGTWGHQQFDGEQKRLIKLLSDWQEARKDRAVLIVAGDVHLGGMSSVVDHEGGPMINQLTASAIGNFPSRDVGYASALAGNVLMKLDAAANSSFEHVWHHEWLFEPNFGLVDIVLPPRGGAGVNSPPALTTTLVLSSGASHIRDIALAVGPKEDASRKAEKPGERTPPQMAAAAAQETAAALAPKNQGGGCSCCVVS